MNAIVNIAGKQYNVKENQHVFAPRLQAEEGSNVEFDNVLLLDDEGKITVGTPNVKKAKVTAKVLEHGKSDKVIVFKKKRRKGYKVKNGHRQPYTKLIVESISK